MADQCPLVDSSVIAFARELDALVDRFTGRVEPAEMAVALSTHLGACCAAYVEPQTFGALALYFDRARHRRMAKASIES